MAGIPLLDLGKPLQLPDPVRQAPVDFRPLNMIGDAVVDYKVKNATAEALAAATGPDGKVNFDKAGAELGRMGLTDQAKPFMELAMRKAALDQSNAHHADNVAQQRAALAETSRFHDASIARQEAQTQLARDAYENPKPTVKEAWNPATGQMEFYEVAPGRPVRPLSQGAPAAAPAPAPVAPAAGAMPAPAPAVAPPAAAAPSPVTAPAVAPVAPAPAAAAAPATSPASVGVPLNDAALTGLAPNRAELVRKVAKYEINPASLSTKGGEREYVMGKAAEYDPSFDQTFYGTKMRTRGAFSAGPEARTLRAVNNLTDHLDTAEELVTALANPNSSPQIVNELRNKFAKQFGATAPSNAAAAAPIIGGEITKVVAGMGAGGVSERLEAAGSILSQAKTEKQALEAIGVVKKLMAGQIHGLQTQYEQGTRLNDFTEKLSPGARKILEGGSKAESAVNVPTPVVSQEEAARYGANPTAALAEARDAIAQAPADKKAATKAYAIQKLKLMKIDPKGLD